jgi:hypothetical protein
MPDYQSFLERITPGIDHYTDEDGVWSSEATMLQRLALCLWLLLSAGAGVWIAFGIIGAMQRFQPVFDPLSNRILLASSFAPVVIVSLLAIIMVAGMGGKHAGIRSLSMLRRLLLVTAAGLTLFGWNLLVPTLFGTLQEMMIAHIFACLVWTGIVFIQDGDATGKRAHRRQAGFWAFSFIGPAGLAIYAATAAGWLTEIHRGNILVVGIGLDVLYLTPALDPAIGIALAQLAGAVRNVLRKE